MPEQNTTPDTTLPSEGFLFGADSEAAPAPSLYTVAAVKAGLGVGPAAGSSLQLQYNAAGVWAGMAGTTWDNTNRTLTIAGPTLTDGSQPILNLTQTWNNASTIFTGILFNATSTASSAGSSLLDLQSSSVSQFSVSRTGAIAAKSQVAINNNNGFFSLGVSTDTIFTRKAAAHWQLGSADVAAPVAQTIGPQSVGAGNSNTAGQPFTIRDSAGTGTGASGGIVFRTAPAGSSGTAQNAYIDVFKIRSSGSIELAKAFTVSTLPTAGTVGRMARVSDGDAALAWGATVVNSGAGATPYLVWDNGSAWTVVGK